jgi:Tfp pilus assembly protein PilX
VRLCKKNKQAGSAGILAVIVLSLLSVIGAGMVGRTSTEIDISAKYRDGVAAQYLAESGARWGFEHLKTQLADSGTRAAIVADTNSVIGKTYVNMGQGAAVRFGSGATAGTVSVSIRLDADDPVNVNKRIIVATAAIGQNQPAQRQVIIPVTLSLTWTEPVAYLTPGMWTNH